MLIFIIPNKSKKNEDEIKFCLWKKNINHFVNFLLTNSWKTFEFQEIFLRKDLLKSFLLNL